MATSPPDRALLPRCLQPVGASGPDPASYETSLATRFRTACWPALNCSIRHDGTGYAWSAVLHETEYRDGHCGEALLAGRAEISPGRGPSRRDRRPLQTKAP